MFISSKQPIINSISIKNCTSYLKLTFLDVKSSGELLIRLSDSSRCDGDDDSGGEGDGEHLVSDLWILLLFLNSCSVGCCCLLLMFRKTRSEVCWLGLTEGDETFVFEVSNFSEASEDFIVVFALFVGDSGRPLEIFCCIKKLDVIMYNLNMRIT